MTDKKKALIAGLGELLWDVFPTGKRLGGAPANFAYHASRFGFRGVAVSALGHDNLGDETVKALEAKGLTGILPRVDFPTGRVEVTLDGKGVPSYHIAENAAWDNIPFTPEAEAAAQQCACVCFGTLAQRSDVSRASVQRFVSVVPEESLRILDVNLRGDFYSSEVLESSLSLCNIVKLNDDELPVISSMLSIGGRDDEEKCREMLCRWGLKCVIYTLGVKGSMVISSDGSSFLPTPVVEVADTVGAGDSFTGAFAACILRGMSLRDAHRRAVDVSAYVCTQSGAMPEIPESLTLL